jgi:hypothetical protein
MVFAIRREIGLLPGPFAPRFAKNSPAQPSIYREWRLTNDFNLFESL